jgi:hypothetical protein
MAELIAQREIPSIAVFQEHREVFEFRINILVLMVPVNLIGLVAGSIEKTK